MLTYQSGGPAYKLEDRAVDRPVPGMRPTDIYTALATDLGLSREAVKAALFQLLYMKPTELAGPVRENDIRHNDTAPALEETPMSEETTTPPKSALREQSNRMTEMLKEAGKAAVVNRAGDRMLNLAQRFAKDQPWLADMLKTETGRDAAKFLIATMVQSAALHTNVMPAGIKSGALAIAERQQHASTFLLMHRHLPDLEGFFVELAALGAQLVADEVPAAIMGAAAAPPAAEAASSRPVRVAPEEAPPEELEEESESAAERLASARQKSL